VELIQTVQDYLHQAVIDLELNRKRGIAVAKTRNLLHEEAKLARDNPEAFIELVNETGLFDEELNVQGQRQYQNDPRLRRVAQIKSNIVIRDKVLASMEDAQQSTAALRSDMPEPEAPSLPVEVTRDSWFDQWVGRFEGTETTINEKGVVTRPYGIEEQWHGELISDWHTDSDIPLDRELTPDEDKRLAKFIWNEKHKVLLKPDDQNSKKVEVRERHKNYAKLSQLGQSIVLDTYWHGNDKYPKLTEALLAWENDKDNDELRDAVFAQIRRVKKPKGVETPSTTFDNRAARNIFTYKELADWQNQDHVERIKRQLKLLEFEGGAKPKGVYLDMFKWDKEDAKLRGE